METWQRRIPEKIRDQQLQALENDRLDIERHVEEAKRRVRALLRRDARILVMDLSQGGATPTVVGDDQAFAELQRTQFGGGDRTNHGEILRRLLGFDPDDPQVTIWDIAKDPHRNDLPYPDAWDAFITTGGPAMPSELRPDHTTANTVWLQRAVGAMEALKHARVPGLAICLGHQLWEHSQGAQVGRLRPQREFGTVNVTLSPLADEIQLLVGVRDSEGVLSISASHSEGVIVPPQNRGVEVIAFNEYTGYQGAVHSLREGASVIEADHADELVLSLQNHPEITAMYLEVLRHIRGEKIRAEGLPLDDMVFSKTPEARKIFLNFIELIARRNAKR